MRWPRRNHTAAFKAKVALAALQGDQTMLERVAKYGVHGSQVTQWKTRLQEAAVGVFLSPAERRDRGAGSERQGHASQDWPTDVGE